MFRMDLLISTPFSMPKRLLAILIAITLGLQFSLAPGAFAQTKFIIKGTNENDEFRKQQVTEFLSDFEIIRKCLRNRKRQQEKPLTALIAACSVIQVFDQTSSLAEAWKKANQLDILPAGTSKSEKLNSLEYLSILFKTSGVTISPLSLKEIRVEMRQLRLRLRGNNLKVFAIAVEQGIIPPPTTQAEAKLLGPALRANITIAEALGYLYQVAISQHGDIPFIFGSPFIQNTGPSIKLESILKEVIRTINTESLYSNDFDEKSAMEAAIKALVNSLNQDKYIEYYTEDEYKNFADSLNGNLEGIGAYIEEREGLIIIVSPIDGSPAERAGLKPEDVITHIDGTSTDGLSLQEAVNRIRGPEGSTVKLTIQRDGKTLDVSIIRAKIDVPNLVTDSKDGFAIIKLIQFGANSAQEMKAALENAIAQNPRGIIIDLRNNPGGFLDQVVTIVDYFISKNEAIVYLKDRISKAPLSSSLDAIVPNMPIGVIINKGSASASEILAAALQSYGIAKIYGENSFGKGTVQNIITLRDPEETRNSAFKLTTAEYLVGGPNGESITIDSVGVIPDSNPPNQNPLLDNEDTEADEALDAVINSLR